MICSVCNKEKDCTEFYTIAGATLEDPVNYCDECREEKEMKDMLCEDCFNRWEGYR